MSIINKNCILRLETSSPRNTYLETIEVLLRLIENVILEPGNESHRIVYIDSQNNDYRKLLSLPGIEDVFKLIGFELIDEILLLSNDVSIITLKKYHEFITQRKNIILHNSPNIVLINEDFTSIYHYNETFFPSISFNNSFLQKLESCSYDVLQYEEEDLQKMGKELIPIDDLTDIAKKKLDVIQKTLNSNRQEEPNLKDLILIELLNWFNSKFFVWVDNLSCSICKNQNITNHSTLENGIRVEIGECCGQISKFYRYNDIRCLLVTRKGRCGEYANCFTFLCRCLNYDARYVLATFDHVWTEIYSDSKKRWLHLDPSDNVIDSPLMYQCGWRRQVDYVIGFSKDDIQDVSWRYTSNHKQTLSARKLSTESELLRAIVGIREKRQKDLSNTSKSSLAKRNLVELVELMIERTPTNDEKRGRSSGSLTWRQARKEETLENMFIFEINDFENVNRQFNIRYSCSKDKYERFIYNSDKSVNISKCYNGWENSVFSSKNIFRKIEKDWKIVYIAREEDTDFGEIVWKFDFSKNNLKIINYNLKFETKTFENGVVNISISNFENSTDIIGSTGIIIKANLIGGKGDIAWQHAQLFRQSLNSEHFPFELNVDFGS